jgi:hypothetical protein
MVIGLARGGRAEVGTAVCAHTLLLNIVIGVVSLE